MKTISTILLSIAIILIGSPIINAQSQRETTDPFGNRWELRNHPRDGIDGVIVVPFLTASRQTIIDKSMGFLDGQWDMICADSNGFIWVGGESGLTRFDPLKPGEGWRQFRPNDNFPAGAIKSMNCSACGLIQVSLKNGDAYEVDMDQKGQQIAVKVDSKEISNKSSWKQLTPMPYSDHDVFGAELNGRIYIPGGGAPHGYPPVMTNFDRMLIYDTRKDTWKRSSPMRINRRYCNVGILDGKIWVIGGFEKVDGEENATATVEIYNPIKDTWTDGPSLDIPCSQSVAGVINERLYVVFSGSEQPGNFAFSISATESQWREEIVPPYPVAQTDGCVFGNKLYILIPAVGLISYDPVAKQWQSGYPPFPTTKAPRAAAVVNYKKQIWVISGTDVPDEKLVWSYSPGKRKWTSRPSLPQPTLWADGLEVGNKLYVFGGARYSAKHGCFVFSNNLFVFNEDKTLKLQ